MMLLLAYESEISLGFCREVLDYDREDSRKVIYKVLDNSYQEVSREVSRSRRFLIKF